MIKIDIVEKNEISIYQTTPPRKRCEMRWGSPHDVGANVLDYDMIVSKFELQLEYYVPFRTLGKSMNSLIPTIYGLNLPSTVLL